MNTPKAHLVDDDEAIRDAVAWLLKSRGIPSTAYASAEEFLAAWSPNLAGCLILDMRMTGMTGLDLFELLQEKQSTLPVIFLTGHGDVPLAVITLKKGLSIFLKSHLTTTNSPPESPRPLCLIPGKGKISPPWIP
jgi:two-component system response regulator DctR